MEIVKFKKDKGNTYKIYFNDDNVVILYDDVIVRYNLLVNKKMDNKKFNEIVKYNDFLNGYYKSIKYINRKMRSELEIEKYLLKLEVNKNDIKEIIKLLYKDGYLNKDVYVRAYINDKYNLSNDGPLKVKKDLISLGYLESDFSDYLYTLDWNDRINKIVLKKVKLNHKLGANALKIKLLNEVGKLGYEKSAIMDVIDNFDFEEDNIYLEKELKKIKNKYSKKYGGNELEFKVINYLYKKGYKIEDIKRCFDEN